MEQQPEQTQTEDPVPIEQTIPTATGQPVFEFLFPNAEGFKRLMKAINTIIGEATFAISADGLSLRTMDPRHVALVDMKLEPSAFTTFEVDVPGTFCVDVDDVLTETFKGRKSELMASSMSVKMTSTPGKIFMTLNTPLVPFNHEHDTLASTGSQPPNPKLAPNAIIKIENMNKLEEVIRKIKSEQLRLITTSRILTVESATDVSKLSIPIEVEAGIVEEIEVQEPPQKALYGQTFLSDLMRGLASLTNKAVLSYKTDYPIRLSGVFNTAFQLDYYLAPRLE